MKISVFGNMRHLSQKMCTTNCYWDLEKKIQCWVISDHDAATKELYKVSL